MVWLLSILVAAPAIINSAGGTTTANGLRVYVGGSGQIQVLKNNQNQFFTFGALPDQATTNQIDNGIYMALGALDQATPVGVVVGPQHDNFTGATPPPGVTYVEWTGASSGGSTGSGSATFNGSYTSGEGTYTISVVYTYVVPDDHVRVAWSLSVPPGNTRPVTIYMAYDSYLGGSDDGPSFHTSALGETAGVYNGTNVEGLRHVSGAAWSHYFAGLNNCMFAPWPGGGGPDCTAAPRNAMSIQRLQSFPDVAESAVVDNGFGVQWSFGVITGARSATNDFLFRGRSPSLTKVFAPATIASDAPTSLIFTIENEPALGAHASLAFNDVLRSPLRIASAPNVVSTGCAGTVTPGASNVAWASGAIAAGTAFCTISVDVTATNVSGSPIDIVNDTTDVSVTNLSDAVGTQIVQVATRPQPQITSITSTTPDGVYGAGDTIAVVVTVSAPSTSTLSLTLSSGAVVDATCSGSTCTASYTVAPGEATMLLDVTNISGTLTDTFGAQNMTPTVPGGANLADSSDIGIDGVAPPAPTLSSPFEGSAEDGTTVIIREDGVPVCSTTASGGAFSCSVVFGPGAHEVDAIATDPAGNVSPPSIRYSFTVPAPPVLDRIPPGVPILTGPLSLVDTGAVTVTGTAEANATVVVSDDDVELCVVTADAAGAFSCDVTLSPGAHVLVATATDAAGNESAPSEPLGVTFAPDDPGALDGSGENIDNAPMITDLDVLNRRGGCGCEQSSAGEVWWFAAWIFVRAARARRSPPHAA